MGISLAEEERIRSDDQMLMRRHAAQFADGLRPGPPAPTALQQVLASLTTMSFEDVQTLALMAESEYIDRLSATRGGKDSPSYDIVNFR